MLWLEEIRERHIRRFLFIFLLFLFTWTNWGSTIEGLYHIVLSARASFIDNIDSELSKGITGSTLAFGKTITLLLAAVFLWTLFDRFLKWGDLDAEYRADEISELKKQNKQLIDNLRTANTELATLSQSIEKIASNNQILAKQQDRVVELGVELEKLSLKTKPDTAAVEPAADTIGLFEAPVRPKTNGSGSVLRRRARPKPKF